MMILLSRRSAILSVCALPFTRHSYAAHEPVLLRDLYNKDLSFSERAKTLHGKRIVVTGFMAPPLRAESNFFVLTRRPMAVCPFCNDAADWPDDIIAVYCKRLVRVIGFNIPIHVTGVLNLNVFKDPQTGFVSRVRLVDSNYERI